MDREILRELIFVGSSQDELREMPQPVRRRIGFALKQAQMGEKHPHAKVLQGFGGAGVLEVVEDYHTDTFRAVYTVRFETAIYVLHAFKKKSKRGDETPRKEMELVKSRLKRAEEIERERWQNWKG
ncbi:MAG: type II toxin-antitoxin system RelE/ParE family toxin [Armatimonadetes bacterium]|nr:type II toxin-antitoxin system RelE/ParE family toxin [Armatimonadota bacterium]